MSVLICAPSPPANCCPLGHCYEDFEDLSQWLLLEDVDMEPSEPSEPSDQDLLPASKRRSLRLDQKRQQQKHADPCPRQKRRKSLQTSGSLETIDEHQLTQLTQQAAKASSEPELEFQDDEESEPPKVPTSKNFNIFLCTLVRNMRHGIKRILLFFKLLRMRFTRVLQNRKNEGFFAAICSG